jgi:hypothetical protein
LPQVGRYASKNIGDGFERAICIPEVIQLYVFYYYLSQTQMYLALKYI